MELKEFVKDVLKDLVQAVDEASRDSSRSMQLTSHKESNQTIEFDIAVSVEDTKGGSGKAGIKVFQIIEGGGETSHEEINSTVTRVKFGIHVSSVTKAEGTQFNSRSQSYE